MYNVIIDSHCINGNICDADVDAKSLLEKALAAVPHGGTIASIFLPDTHQGTYMCGPRRTVGGQCYRDGACVDGLTCHKPTRKCQCAVEGAAGVLSEKEVPLPLDQYLLKGKGGCPWDSECFKGKNLHPNKCVPLFYKSLDISDDGIVSTDPVFRRYQKMPG